VGGIIGLGLKGVSNILDILYEKKQIGSKRYTFSRSKVGGEYDLNLRLGDYDPSLIDAESTKSFKNQNKDKWELKYYKTVNTNTTKTLKAEKALKKVHVSPSSAYSTMPKDLYIGICKSVYAVQPNFKKSSLGVCEQVIDEKC
jgi:hypothetical protein